MPPSRPRQKKIPFEFTSGARSGEPTKQVAKLHHELRTLKNEIVALQAQLAHEEKRRRFFQDALNLFRDPPRRALAMLADWPLSRVVETGAVESVVPIVEWARNLEEMDKKFKSFEIENSEGSSRRYLSVSAFVAAGKKGEH